jgi:hypothetical protein
MVLKNVGAKGLPRKKPSWAKSTIDEEDNALQESKEGSPLTTMAFEGPTERSSPTKDLNKNKVNSMIRGTLNA